MPAGRTAYRFGLFLGFSYTTLRSVFLLTNLCLKSGSIGALPCCC